jgi:hypothetical protein
MRKLMTAGAVGLALAAPLSAQAAASDQEVADLKAQVQALLARVQQLESRQAPAAGDPARIAQIETRLADVEESNDRQTDALAQAATKAKGMDWASKIKLKGDFRVREEIIQEETRADRNRQRIRARFGLDAKVSDALSAGFQIATGSTDDPRSTNSTLTDSNARKGIQLDLAYLAWKPMADTTVTVGKQKYPWYRASGSLFYDGDINPEGVAVSWGGKSGPFVNAWGLVLAERSSAADTNIVGAQLGWVSGSGLTVAASYSDYSGIEGRSLSFADYPAGNTTYSSDGSCNPLVAGSTRCYLNDYSIVGVSAEYAFKLGRFPATVWADYLENTAADDLNRGYNVGFKLGKASDPGSWEFGALYQDVEADAQWGGFIDSDFAGGLTQGKGVQLKAAYAPIKNTSLNLAYFDNTKSYDTSGERDYQRLQLDFSLKF